MAKNVDGSSVPVVVATWVNSLVFAQMYWGGALLQVMGLSAMITVIVSVIIAKMVCVLRTKCGYGLWQRALVLLSFCLF